MAVIRTTPKCLKCGRDIEPIFQDQCNLPTPMHLIGDTFIKWDWENHKCEENCIYPYVSESFRVWLTDELTKAKIEMDEIDASKIHKHNVFAQGKIRGKYFTLKMILDQIRNVR